MFIVLTITHLESSKEFYEQLGCTFEQEQHGGPIHFAATEPATLELYPPLKTLPATDQLFIGITVDNPESVKTNLIANFGGKEPEPIIPTSKSGIATLRDPAGILVRLFPKN